MTSSSKTEFQHYAYHGRTALFGALGCAFGILFAASLWKKWVMIAFAIVMVYFLFDNTRGLQGAIAAQKKTMEELNTPLGKNKRKTTK